MNEILLRDLEKLIDFRNHVKRFNTRLSEEFSDMKNHVEDIREDWNDQQYVAFHKDFDEAAQGMRTYLSRQESHEGFLDRLIERAIALRDTRM